MGKYEKYQVKDFPDMSGNTRKERKRQRKADKQVYKIFKQQRKDFNKWKRKNLKRKLP